MSPTRECDEMFSICPKSLKDILSKMQSHIYKKGLIVIPRHRGTGPGASGNQKKIPVISSFEAIERRYMHKKASRKKATSGCS